MLATVSPGKILKLTTAVATVGSTLDLLLPCSIVTAVVVRAPAAELGAASKACSTSGDNNHKLAKGRRLASGIENPILSNII